MSSSLQAMRGALASRPGRLVVGCGLGFALVALLLSLLQQRIYSASASLLLSPRVVANLTPGVERPDLLSELELARSEEVARRVREEVGFKPFVDVQQVRASNAIEFTVEATSPERAVAAATAFVDTYVAVRKERLLEDFAVARTSLVSQLERVRKEAATARASLDQLRLGAEATDQPDVVSDVNRLELSTGVGSTQVPVELLRLTALQRRLDDLDIAIASVDLSSPTVLTAPEEPEGPTRPNLLLNVVVGGLLGLAVGITIRLVVRPTPPEQRAATVS